MRLPIVKTTLPLAPDGVSFCCFLASSSYRLIRRWALSYVDNLNSHFGSHETVFGSSQQSFLFLFLFIFFLVQSDFSLYVLPRPSDPPSKFAARRSRKYDIGIFASSDGSIGAKRICKSEFWGRMTYIYFLGWVTFVEKHRLKSYFLQLRS